MEDNRKHFLIGTRLDASERAALLALAELDDRKPADILRRLIREAARARGIMIGVTPAQMKAQRGEV